MYLLSTAAGTPARRAAHGRDRRRSRGRGRAGRISSEAGAWVSRMGAGGDDAGDAAGCAMRARMAAERAEHCSTTAEAWSCARLAWAIVASTREASERVNAAIAESLIVASA